MGCENSKIHDEYTESAKRQKEIGGVLNEFLDSREKIKKDERSERKEPSQHFHF